MSCKVHVARKRNLAGGFAGSGALRGGGIRILN